VSVTGPNSGTTRGIDVSYHQGTINWSAVAASGVEFAFVRLSDGARFRDPRFAINWEQAKSAGVIRGAYQFFRPNQNVAQQAQMMIDAIGTYTPGDLPPVIDVEATGNLRPAQVAAKVRQWVDAVESALDVKPIIYSGKYFWRDQVGGDTSFESNPLWIAQYTSLCPDIPSPWTRWTFWHHSARGTVPGIRERVDLNKFNGSRAQLLAFANGEAPTRVAALPFSWTRDASGHYTFTATAASADIERVEIRVDDYLIGAASPTGGQASVPYVFNVEREARVVEVRGLDAGGAVVAVGNGLIDSTDTPEVYVTQNGESDYEIGLDSEASGAATVEVTSDGFPLTDSVSGRFKSERGATRYVFSSPGTHQLRITSRDTAGNVLFQETRTLLVR